MSIDYYAVASSELSTARSIVEGDVPEEVEEIDKEHVARALEAIIPDFVRFVKDFAALAKRERMTPEEARLQFSSIELNWDRDSYVQVVVDDYAIAIHHGFGGGDLQMEVLGKVLHALDAEGLAIYDPQYDELLAPDQF